MFPIKTLSTETSPMSHVTATVMGGSNSYWKRNDPKEEKGVFLFFKVVSNIKILSTEASPMSHVTATVVGGSHSYVKGSDPKIE